MPVLSSCEIQDNLKTSLVGRKVIVLERVSSTQDIARELVEKNAPGGTVVLAEVQSQGRGRHGRRWYSTAGLDLLASVILYPRFSNLTVVSLTLGVAIAIAIRNFTGIRAFVKWPNDVIVHDKKVAGVLAERAGTSLIAGIGINVNQVEFHESVAGSASSLLVETGKEVDRASFTCEVLRQIDRYYLMLRGEGFSPVREELKHLSSVLGGQVAVFFNGKTVRGQAIDVDESGALVVRVDNGMHVRVPTGEVKGGTRG